MNESPICRKDCGKSYFGEIQQGSNNSRTNACKPIVTMIYRRDIFAICCILGFVTGVTCLNLRNGEMNTSSRRAFCFERVPAAAAAFFTVSTVPLSGFNKAMAYEMREVGGADRSAATEAMNRQAYETNNRLERDGFKLDTREEEQARLSDALSSFSYDSSTSGSKTKSTYSSRQTNVSNANKEKK